MRSLFAEKSSVRSLSELVEAASASDRSKRQPKTTIYIDSFFFDSSLAAQKDFAAELQANRSVLVISGEFSGGRSALARYLMGLSEDPAGRDGISACLTDPDVVVPFIPKRPTLYRKNGMLVGHIGQRITPEDVARILAEE